VNVPLEAGATDADYAFVYRDVVVPVLAEFKPDLTLVSAGFDAHERDSLAQMRVTTDGYTTVVAMLWAAVREHAGGKLVAVTEGGYDLEAFGACLDATVATLSRDPVPALPAAARARRLPGSRWRLTGRACPDPLCRLKRRALPLSYNQ
jgi:acetoin utilization deacetylase AcuC-like enzyme